MSNTQAIPPISTEATSAYAVRAVAGAEGQAKAEQQPPEAQSQPDLRLVIEEDKASGSFIYKTLDRSTGQVVQQYPREEVLRLRELPGYEPGDLTDSTS
ncbi:MAG: hypothetical protein U1E50_11530 [Caulobacteraceae bacterium]